MHRTLLIALAAVVLGATLATGATILLADDPDLAISSPSPSGTFVPIATTEVTTPTPGGSATAEAGAPPGASPAASAGSPGARAGSSPTPSPRSAASIDCGEEPKFCSRETAGLKVVADKNAGRTSSMSRTSYEGAPKIDMTSTIVGPDKKAAGEGKEVELIRVVVEVRNDTSRTFVFPSRQVVLDIFRNGKLYDRLETDGEGFEMTPGGSMTGKFERPIDEDGTYTWRAKTWYRAK